MRPRATATLRKATSTPNRVATGTAKQPTSSATPSGGSASPRLPCWPAPRPHRPGSAPAYRGHDNADCPGKPNCIYTARAGDRHSHFNAWTDQIAPTQPPARGPEYAAHGTPGGSGSSAAGGYNGLPSATATAPVQFPLPLASNALPDSPISRTVPLSPGVVLQNQTALPAEPGTLRVYQLQAQQYSPRDLFNAYGLLPKVIKEQSATSIVGPGEHRKPLLLVILPPHLNRVQPHDDTGQRPGRPAHPCHAG